MDLERAPNLGYNLPKITNSFAHVSSRTFAVTSIEIPAEEFLGQKALI